MRYVAFSSAGSSTSAGRSSTLGDYTGRGCCSGGHMTWNSMEDRLTAIWSKSVHEKRIYLLDEVTACP